MALLATGVLAGPAAAQQPNPDQVVKQLKEAQQQAEALTQQWHAAKDDLKAKKAETEATRQAAASAKQVEDRFRAGLDVVASSFYESGNLDQLNALLASDSPQQYLDKLFVLETLAADHRVTLEQTLAVVEQTRRAEAAANDAIAKAQQATDEIEKRKREAEIRISEVQKLVSRLTPAQREARLGPDLGGPLGPIVGSGKGPAALRAALTKMGRPYQWGAEGPNSFDCSGLTQWAFKQVGVNLPRSTHEQVKVGTPVSKGSLQAGDLVFFYADNHHMGIYAGEGKVLNAVQTGDVVRYSDLDARPFYAARRI